MRVKTKYGGKVIPDEDPGSPEGLLVHVPVGVVNTEGLVDSGALVHELDRATGVGGDVADGEQPMGEGGSTYQGIKCKITNKVLQMASNKK